MLIQAYGRRLRGLLFGGWLFRGFTTPPACPGEVASGRCTVNPFTGSVTFSNLSGEVMLK